MAPQSAHDTTDIRQDAQEAKPHIKIQTDGPYLVTGSPKLARRIRIKNAEGEPVA